ncbi:hypothetical protein PCANC_03799 [Puccinia coronata f. sp. avenae]|uniref:Uncharacterized protein n=1 Tax=Puccinia coronata f. sp. avenae TaxID=200324 RepID=A0A2N5T785_9BASI|nr:hypothetical protein PCANC_03799 [Puccinia coronata f. sp. avenae]
MLVSEYPSQFTLSSAANSYLARDDASLIRFISILTLTRRQEYVNTGDIGEIPYHAIWAFGSMTRIKQSSWMRDNFFGIISSPLILHQPQPTCCNSCTEDDTLEENLITMCGVQVQNWKQTDKLDAEPRHSTPSNAGINLKQRNPYLVLSFSLSDSKSHPKTLQGN